MELVMLSNANQKPTTMDINASRVQEVATIVRVNHHVYHAKLAIS